jgi:predicted ATP-binding protein involved in virulence
MKISGIKIENNNLFEDLSISFLDENTNEPHNVVLLVGENGKGKTTVLRSIASCFTINNHLYGGDILDFNNVSNNMDFGSIAIDTMMNEEEVSCLGEFDKYEFYQYIVKKNGIEKNSNTLEKYNSFDLLDSNNQYITPNILRMNGQFSNKSYEGSLILFFDVFRILPKLEINGPNSSNLPSSPKENSLAPSIRTQSIIERFQYTKQWLVNLDYKEAKLYREKNGQDSGLMIEVVRALNALFSPYEFSRITGKSKIMFKTPKGEVDIDDLSDGMKSVFTIIGEMLFRFSMPYMDLDAIDIKAILNTEAIVLIDEIDCHLHPKWQLNIIPSLRGLFPNVQFIITTHAPLVVSSVYPDEVYQLKETEEGN